MGAETQAAVRAATNAFAVRAKLRPGSQMSRCTTPRPGSLTCTRSRSCAGREQGPSSPCGGEGPSLLGLVPSSVLEAVEKQEIVPRSLESAILIDTRLNDAIAGPRQTARAATHVHRPGDDPGGDAGGHFGHQDRRRTPEGARSGLSDPILSTLEPGRRPGCPPGPRRNAWPSRSSRAGVTAERAQVQDLP